MVSFLRVADELRRRIACSFLEVLKQEAYQENEEALFLFFNTIQDVIVKNQVGWFLKKPAPFCIACASCKMSSSDSVGRRLKKANRFFLSFRVIGRNLVTNHGKFLAEVEMIRQADILFIKGSLIH